MPIEQLLKHEEPRSTITRTPAPQFGSVLALPPPSPLPGPYLDARSVASGLATLYERLRNTLDFRDEHLIRIYAIRRILKRRLVRGSLAEKLTTPFLQELVRAGYMNASAVPEASVPEFESMINKYIHLFNALVTNSQGEVDRKLWDWVYVLAANELEETLVPAPDRLALAERLSETLGKEGILRQWSLEPDQATRQTTIAVYRSFLKANNELISWQLFRRRYPQWVGGASIELIAQVAAEFSETRETIEKDLHHPCGERLTRAIQPISTTLWLLQESLHGRGDRETVLMHPDLLRAALTETIQRHYKETWSRLRRTLWRSLLYISITKMAIAVLIEAPAERLLVGHVNLVNLGFNILVPIMFLLIFGLSVRIPGERNTLALLTIADHLVYQGTLGLDPLRRPAIHRVWISRAFNAFYGFIYLISFGAVVSLLLSLGFTVLGILLFLFFLTIVSFFGFRIREQAQQLIVTKGQERFLVFLAVLFFLPIVRTGRWISQQSSRINIFLYLFDLFIEAPLQSFLEFFDKFTGFVREKKEDVTT